MSEVKDLGDGIASHTLRLGAEADLRALERELTGLQGEERRVLLLEGTAQVFSMGASKEMLLGDDPARTLRWACEDGPRVVLSVPVPTVAVMEGHAIGGGFLIGLLCDIAVLSEESLYGTNFIALGFTPAFGSTALLEAAVGAPLAREMLLTGRVFKGRELKSTGCPIAHNIVPRSQVRERALEIAAELARVPSHSSRLLKATLAQQRLRLLEAAIGPEREMHRSSFAKPETLQQLRGELGHHKAAP